jgi:hypothetical protein
MFCGLDTFRPQCHSAIILLILVTVVFLLYKILDFELVSSLLLIVFSCCNDSPWNDLVVLFPKIRSESLEVIFFFF